MEEVAISDPTRYNIPHCLPRDNDRDNDNTCTLKPHYNGGRLIRVLLNIKSGEAPPISFRGRQTGCS